MAAWLITGPLTGSRLFLSVMKMSLNLQEQFYVKHLQTEDSIW